MIHDTIVLPHGYEPRFCATCACGDQHYTPKPYREAAALVADRERYYRVTAQAKAERRPRTYAELFGEN